MLDTDPTSVLNCPMMPQCYHATMPRCHYATIQPIQRCTMQCLNNHKLHNNSQLFIQSNVTFTLRKFFCNWKAKKIRIKKQFFVQERRKFNLTAESWINIPTWQSPVRAVTVTATCYTIHHCLNTYCYKRVSICVSFYYTWCSTVLQYIVGPMQTDHFTLSYC